MKILFVSSRLPHAKTLSGHVIVGQRIRRLIQRGHEVGLVSYRRSDDAPFEREWAAMLHQLSLVDFPHGTAGHLMQSLRHPAPYPFSAYRSDAMMRAVGDAVEQRHYDVAIAEFSVMAPFLSRNPYLSAVHKIISVHHCLSIVSRKAWEVRRFSPSLLRERLAHRRLARYEFKLYRGADRVVVLTPEERYGMLKYAPDLRIHAIPSGVDTDLFKPDEQAVRENAILFVGRYNKEPNRDAVRWFVTCVWPLLKTTHPSLRLYLVGPSPTSDMLEMARKDTSIIITGEVPDVRPYLAKVRALVCPIRLGSGMRGKILEAMASGVPVVTTTLGAEGIPVQMGENALLADTPDIMSRHIALLLDDPHLQAQIARNARDMVIHRFAWTRSLTLLEMLLREVTGK